MSLHLLTTILLSNPLARASVIDTTGSFPVSLLAKIIRLCTASQLGWVDWGVEKLDIGQAVDARVEETLGRVAISRAFDIEGVWEVLSEISADCQSAIPARDLSNLAEKGAEDPELKSGRMKSVVAETSRNQGSALEAEAGGAKELEIVDSEAEEEDIELEDELEEAEISQRGNTDLAPDKTNALHSLPRKKDPTLRSKPPESKGRTEIVIIDNMTTPISELFSRRERSFGTSQPFPSLPLLTISPRTTSANPYHLP
jgi:hypothetical protein